MWFDSPENCTVEMKGEKSADIRRGAPTVVLKRIPEKTFPKGVLVRAQKYWMDNELALDRVKRVQQNRPGTILAKRSLLVLNSFHDHLSDKIKERLHSIDTDMAVIPGDFTGMLLPLDVSISRDC